MNRIALFAIAGVFSIVACSDENAPIVWNVAESSSSVTVAESSSGSVVAESSSSSIVIPDSLSPRTSSGAVSPSSSSTDSAAQSSSSAPSADTVWHQANLTWYTSWPEPGSEECIEYNGCTWAGYFAGVEGQMTEEWVSQHNIIAVHEKDWKKYKLKTFRLRMNGSTIDAVVYDMCSDSDCDGCCTENAGEIGFLIDIEKYTRERFDGNGDGVVEWTCLDCE
ncbi:hypothetical protein [Fibrobacter sp.]|uniref:hypothetical protein n=1 Tax=Fibrobacter sp. TaxID=35828 RepID=UPI003870A025